jgi:hypothetical protein
VTEGSVIVELGFVDLGAAHPSPSDIVTRLAIAAESGELEDFGLIELNIGQKVVSKASISRAAAMAATATAFYVRFWFVFVFLFWFVFLISLLIVCCCNTK